MDKLKKDRDALILKRKQIDSQIKKLEDKIIRDSKPWNKYIDSDILKKVITNVILQLDEQHNDGDIFKTNKIYIDCINNCHIDIINCDDSPVEYQYTFNDRHDEKYKKYDFNKNGERELFFKKLFYGTKIKGNDDIYDEIEDELESFMDVVSDNDMENWDI